MRKNSCLARFRQGILEIVAVVSIFSAPSAAQVTISGNLTATAGQNTENLYNLNNVQMIDGNKYACSDVGLNAAIAALPAIGGTVDARGCQGTATIASTVTLGSATQMVTLLMDRVTLWNCTITGGTACWQVFPGSSMVVLGPGEGKGNSFGLSVSNSANISNVIKVINSATTRALLDHVYIQSNTSATVTDSVVNLANPLDGMSINNLGIAPFSNTYLLKITNAAGSVGGVGIFAPDIDCGGIAGCKPVLIDSTATSGSMGGIVFHGGTLTHPGSGGLAIVTLQDTGGNAQNQGVAFLGTFFESKNAGDIGILCNGCRGLYGANLFFSAVVAGADCIRFSGAAGNAVLHNVNNFNGWTNTINNQVTSDVITNSRVESYHFDRFVTTATNVWTDSTSREATLDSNGFAMRQIANSTGLQVFNTPTTCTTGATINTPCTTAAISLPVGYSDTNYRVQCTGLSPTAFPQIQTVTKSNTTFTIKLNNLTAAAASYTSFDCTVGHN